MKFCHRYMLTLTNLGFCALLIASTVLNVANYSIQTSSYVKVDNNLAEGAIGSNSNYKKDPLFVCSRNVLKVSTFNCYMIPLNTTSSVNIKDVTNEIGIKAGSINYMTLLKNVNLNQQCDDINSKDCNFALMLKKNNTQDSSEWEGSLEQQFMLSKFLNITYSIISIVVFLSLEIRPFDSFFMKNLGLLKTLDGRGLAYLFVAFISFKLYTTDIALHCSMALIGILMVIIGAMVKETRIYSAYWCPRLVEEPNSKEGVSFEFEEAPRFMRFSHNGF